jgi:SAM-dependent methyltransferase
MTAIDVVCSICGGNEFQQVGVLWPELVSEWKLSESEHEYVDRQQGCLCTSCGSSLRVIALGNAIRTVVGTEFSLQEAIQQGKLNQIKILDCNGAEGISKALSALPSYFRADYPEYDMRALPFQDGVFDLVVHSDTLEHIDRPVDALRECRRILSASGRLCFTVPVIHGRMTLSRIGLAPSFHGYPGSQRDDFLVHTEYGADVWTHLFSAGFSSVTLTQVDFPSAIALTAWD